jgi:hypothetical protein
MLKVGARYGLNLVSMVAAQEGYVAGALAGGRFVQSEVAKLPRLAAMTVRGRVPPRPWWPVLYSDEILALAYNLGIEVRPYRIDVPAFWDHVRSVNYSVNYAGGTMSEGGAREEKLLEYYVSLDLLALRASDVLIDVASEWSIFPDVARRVSGASVYRQDLIYKPGLHGNRIGGSAACMPVQEEFADKVVLHNAYEHFEGTADTDFVTEAWRILRPGGLVCILPLNICGEYCIVTDPLVDRRGIVWDEGARVAEIPWFHNRFGRLYSASALRRRVLEPAAQCGFEATIYHIENPTDVHWGAYLHFALMLHKPG